MYTDDVTVITYFQLLYSQWKHTIKCNLVPSWILCTILYENIQTDAVL